MKQLDNKGRPKGQPPEQETSKTFRFQTPIPKLPEPIHERIYETLGINPNDSLPAATGFAADILISRLQASQQHVREDAIERLGKGLGNNATRPFVLKRLAKALPDMTVDTTIAKILFDALNKGIDISPILPDVTNAIINGQRQTGREHAGILLKHAASKKIDVSKETAVLIVALNDQKIEHVADLGIALFELVDAADLSKFIPDLEHIAENGRPEAQFYAIMALVKLGVERDLETDAERLKTTLHSVSLFERLSAARILAQLIVDKQLPLNWLVLFEPATIASNDTLKHNFIIALKTLAQGGERTAEYIMKHDSFFSANDMEIKVVYIEALGIAAKNGADVSQFAERLLAKLIISQSIEEETAAIKTLAHMLKNEKTTARLIKAIRKFCEENIAEEITEARDAFMVREHMDRIPRLIEKLGNKPDEDTQKLAVAFATAIIRSNKMAKESAKNTSWFIGIIKRLGEIMKEFAKRDAADPQ